jgi:hypothetical protein
MPRKRWGLNSPPGFSVNVVHAPPRYQESSTDRIERVLHELKMEAERTKPASDQDDNRATN